MAKAADARTFGQDLMRGEHVVGAAPDAKRLLLPRTSDLNFYGAKRAKEAELGRELSTAEFLEMYEDAAPANAGTSIFDPVLCELVYRWFCPPGGTVLDPFAGGSVRGIVAARLGLNYVGVELRGEQIAANREQAAAICGENQPVWVEGDSRELRTLCAGVEADFVFSCPPYADLERYSDDPRDLSTVAYPAFRRAYTAIIRAAVGLLRPDRFACFVVGDVRDARGFYYGFPWHTVDAFDAAGARLYNDAVLVTAAGSLAIRAGKQFQASRKLGKAHQNVFVFAKGDPRVATDALGSCEFGEVEAVSDEAALAVPGSGDAGDDAFGEPL